MTRHRPSPLALLVAIGIGVTGFGAPALAQSVRSLGDFRDWSSYAAADGAGPICFALTRPTDVSPLPDGYSQAYLYLTNRPSENVTNEINVVAGFEFAPDTSAVLSVGGQSFALFTQADAAWLEDASQSATLAGVMRAGATLTIEGTSAKGIKILQTYSLAGATAASRAIEGDC